MMRAIATILTILALAPAAYAQSRQPAQLTTHPSVTPQTLDALDKTGNWNKLGQFDVTAHVFQSYNSDAIDVRQFGCVADGVTDQAACINDAIARTPGCVLIPATQEGFFIAADSTINATKCLTGAFFNPGVSTPYPAAFAGQPWIKCATSATSICVKTTYNGAYIANVVIATAFPPTAGSVGLQVKSGYNSQVRNVHVSGFDRCAQWGPTGNADSNAGISSRAIGLNLSWCQTYYMVQDGWPELYITDGRWGSNGQGMLNPPPKAMVYITKSDSSGSGGGPNSLVMTGVQVNPGGGAVECMVKWGGYVGTGGAREIYRFIGNHWEFLPPPNAPAQKGIFCSDSTVASIKKLQVIGSEFQFDGAGGGGVFALDAATAIDEMYLSNSYFNADDTTLVFKAGGTNATTSHWAQNFFGGPLTLTGHSSQRLSMTDNVTGSATITGTWGQLTVVNPYYGSTWNDGAARGSISVTNGRNAAWTPVVKFGGTPSSIAWTGGGLMQRTPNGGFIATWTMNGPGSGTETATGSLSISGLPYKCVAGFVARPTNAQSANTAAVGAMLFKVNSSDPADITGLKSTSTGYSGLTPADFTNATQIAGEIECKWAN